MPEPEQISLSRALLRRIESYETFPLEALETVTELRRSLDAIEGRAIAIARDRGATWEDIADATGVTRQAIYQRYHRNGHRP